MRIQFFCGRLVDTVGELDPIPFEVGGLSPRSALLETMDRCWPWPRMKARALGSALVGALGSLQRRGAQTNERRWFIHHLDEHGNRIESGIVSAAGVMHVCISLNGFRYHLAPGQIDQLADSLKRIDARTIAIAARFVASSVRGMIETAPQNEKPHLRARAPQ